MDDDDDDDDDGDDDDDDDDDDDGDADADADDDDDDDDGVQSDLSGWISWVGITQKNAVSLQSAYQYFCHMSFSVGHQLSRLQLFIRA